LLSRRQGSPVHPERYFVRAVQMGFASVAPSCCPALLVNFFAGSGSPFFSRLVGVLLWPSFFRRSLSVSVHRLSNRLTPPAVLAPATLAMFSLFLLPSYFQLVTRLSFLLFPASDLGVDRHQCVVFCLFCGLLIRSFIPWKGLCAPESE